jgi:hypothetical protein
MALRQGEQLIADAVVVESYVGFEHPSGSVDGFG